jgi:Family of unknown function (DUF6625)
MRKVLNKNNFMTAKKTRSAFLVPFFGDLPPYFRFWAKSCEPNSANFHWFVYSDRITCRYALNKAVTMVPYQFDEMVDNFRDLLGIKVPSHYVRKVCDYRIMFYFLRRHRERLDEYDFIGYTDMDMIYGRLAEHLPSDMSRYSMISGDDDKPCGPLTLMDRSCMNSLLDSDEIISSLEHPEHRTFNESSELMSRVAGNKPVFCSTDPIQPARTGGFNYRRSFAVWNKGTITVWDNSGNKKEGGFYHFSRYKNRKRFRVGEHSEENEQWGIYKYGIIDIRSKRTFHRLKLSLLL